MKWRRGVPQICQPHQLTAGGVQAQSNTALGSTSSGVIIRPSGALELVGSIAIGAEAITISGTGISADGAIRNISGNNSIAGTITMTADSRINSDLGALTLDTASIDAITGTYNITLGGSGDIVVNDPITTGSKILTKDGSGRVTLAAANTYTGATTIIAIAPGISQYIYVTSNTTPDGTWSVVQFGASTSVADATSTTTGQVECRKMEERCCCRRRCSSSSTRS